MLSVEIRRPQISDKEELFAFFDLVLKDTFIINGLVELTEDYEQECKEKREHLSADFASGGVDRHFLIAVDKQSGNLLGCIAYGPASSLIVMETNGALAGYMEIGTAFVHPNYQNKGIGTMLLNAIIRTLEIREIHHYCLDSGYAIAQKIWTKKLGEPDYLLKDYWGDGAHHMIWKRSIERV